MNLKYEKKDIFTSLEKEDLKRCEEYAKEYINFLSLAKTEYLCVELALKALEKDGFVEISTKKNLKLGDKIYFVNKEKSIFVAVIGKEDLINGVNMVGAHIDSPRIDLKPMPLYETNGIAMLKTQYYGGIKKYQWLSIPLSMYGVIYTQEGKKIDISIGDNKDDPCFTITDVLPHMAKDQLKANASEFIDPEKMGILFGSTKTSEKGDTVKENILKILNKKYGIKEIDFARSEISFVPSNNARFVGIDKSMIGGYGQDDRVCAYATIKALIDVSNQKDLQKTCIGIIVDKEEVGSIGNTSMSTLAFDMFIEKILEKTNKSKNDLLEVYYNSKMLSADVASGIDPNYEEVSDIQNSNMIGCGVALEKYSGSGGKSGGSDANAKYVSEVMNIFENNNIFFQMGTLGKIGKGGGGTIAYILAQKGVDVIDCGTPVISMHSPFEITSKYDVYMTYKAYKVFYKK
ncbi:MAG: aminopeptidase [Clostridia bacterium]